MNFIFLSPNFPDNYWHFCQELKNNGVNVLGIGDAPYEKLSDGLKGALNEYYRVDSLEDYESVYRGVAFLAFKHGRIDWIESNNEYWLERDAHLRTDFNIRTGFKNQDIKKIKYKSAMKKYYEKAGIPAARWQLVDDIANAYAFVQKVGYPIIVKPDNGVGANNTYKIHNDSELERFFIEIPPVQYIMEEFIDGQICSYDAVINSKGEPLFESGNITLKSIMDIVNNEEDSCYYIVKELAKDVREAGRAAAKSFGVKSRFVHLEFFRLLKDHKYLGRKGQIVALEANMRPSGGYTPDMLNFAGSTNVYKLWADMIVYDRVFMEKERGIEKYYCPFAGRRDNKRYSHSHEDILKRFEKNLCMEERMPDVLAPAMGNQIYIAKFKTKEAMDEFFDYLSE